MATELNPAELEFARGLDAQDFPARLRCAQCQQAAFEAMKTDCCDTTLCGACAANFSGTCQSCGHDVTPENARADKRLRITFKAHIKNLLQKRKNAQAAAEKQEEEQAQNSVEENAVIEPVPPQAEEVEVAAETAPEVPMNSDDIPDQEAQDNDDDPDNVEIITEIPGEQEPDFDQPQEHQENNYDEQQDDEANQQDAPTNGFGNMQNAFNNGMMMPNMNGINPMMAMQNGMGMPPFGMFPGMMGMPNMDPSMLFAGMNGMANMMNGNMMNGNFGMGDMNDFTSYNPQFGNRFDDRGQSFFPSNRGYGRGGYGHRGRGQGFYNRGGRGRGGWQYQNHHQHNNFQRQQYQDHNQHHDNQESQSVRDNDQLTDQANDHHDHVADDASKHEINDESQDQTDAAPTRPPPVTYQRQEGVEDEVDYDDDEPYEEPTSIRAPEEASADQQPQRIASPPINAPTGPKAMRDGLPNSGRYSRAQNQEVRHAAEESRGAAERDQRPASSHSFKGNKDKRSRYEEYGDEREAGGRDRDAGRARSRSPSRHDHKREKYSSRHDDDEARRHSREGSYELDRSKRRDKKREKDHSGESREKRRSVTPEYSSRRHRSHREEKDRSHRERSREKSSKGRYHEQDAADEGDGYYSRKKKSKSHGRHDDESNRQGDKTWKKTQPLVLDHSDDIGFRIKGSKAREDKNTTAAPPTGPAAHRDPYAEERERMKEQRLERDAQRRQGTHSSSKRGRDDADYDEYASKKKRSRPRAKYEDEIENHEHERESRRWR